MKYLHNEKIDYTYPLHRLVHDLWTYIKPYKKTFFVGIFLRLLGDIVWLYPALALASIITFFTHYSRGQSLDQLFTILLFWILATFWRIFSLNYAKKLCYNVSEKINIDSKQATISRLASLPQRWHEKENTGNKLQRVYRGGSAFSTLIQIIVNNLIEICVNFIAMPFIIAQGDMFIALLFVVYMIFFFLLGKLLMKKAVAAQHHVNIQEEKVSGISFELMNNIRSIKVLGMGHSLLAILNATFTDLYKKIQERIFRFTVRNASLEICTQLFRFSGFLLIIYGILNGRYELSFLVLYNGYFGRISEAVRELTDLSQQFVIARLSIARMQEIFKEPIEQEDDPHKIQFPKDWNALRLKNITFTYQERPIFKKLALIIARGQRVGIVGPSGAGKSTLFKLLLKEYQTYSGTITIGDTPLQDIQRKSYFEHVAVVLQDTEVFNISLKDNITLANLKQADNKKLFEQALTVSHVSDFISRLPQGVDTLIGEKGVKLSGGEKQRLGIARAIFKQPEILLLDEATSHLDLESEEKIRDSLHQFFQQVTALVIAHRLTTVREMDRIIVLEQGRIIEHGSFDQLMKKHGRFSELWKKQKI